MSDTKTHKFLIAALPWYIAAVTTVIAGLSALAIRNTTRIDQNTQRIQAGLTRVCERENPIRAEVHLVYRTRTAGASKQQLAKAAVTEPLLAALLDAQVKQVALAQRRTDQGLPILNCQPNLEGDRAQVLSPRAQDAYVKAYSQRRLNPITGLPRRR